MLMEKKLGTTLGVVRGKQPVTDKTAGKEGKDVMTTSKSYFVILRAHEGSKVFTLLTETGKGSNFRKLLTSCKTLVKVTQQKMFAKLLCPGFTETE